MATAAERDALRSETVAPHNVARDQIEQQYVQDKKDLEDQYHSDLKDNDEARRAALVAAGLNPNGSDPQGRPQG